MKKVFQEWKTNTIKLCRKLNIGLNPKQEIHNISESLLKQYDSKALTDKYSMYQYIMEYWEETMQDDFYELAADGWKAGKDVKRLEKKTKKGETETSKDIPGIEGLEGRLIPPTILIQEYFSEEHKSIVSLENDVEIIKAKIEDLISENIGEDGLLDDLTDDKGKLSKTTVVKRFKALTPKKMTKIEEEYEEEYKILELLCKYYKEESEKTTLLQKMLIELEQKVITKYPVLKTEDIFVLVIERKWISSLEFHIQNEMDNISRRLTNRIKDLADRYDYTLPQLSNDLVELTSKVENHLKKMKFKW